METLEQEKEQGASQSHDVWIRAKQAIETAEEQLGEVACSMPAIPGETRRMNLVLVA